MVAGNRNDRRRIIAVRFIELGVVMLGLAEAIDDVAEMKEERRLVVDFERAAIGRHLVGYAQLVAVDPHIAGAGIADGVKDDSSRLTDQSFDSFAL